jgi:hypothetical protein
MSVAADIFALVKREQGTWRHSNLGPCDRQGYLEPLGERINEASLAVPSASPAGFTICPVLKSS